MNFSKELVGKTIEDKFINIIQDFLDEYYMDLENQNHVFDYFSEIVESIEFAGISGIDLIDFSEQKVNEDIEVTGTLGLAVFLDGYVYFEGENVFMEGIECSVVINFMFYYSSLKDEFNDFSITDVFV